MPYTSDNQVSAYAALNERGPSRIGQLLLQQRPSWFTYATKDLIDHPQRLPRSVAAALAALQSANPELAKKHYALITEERPLPVLGTNGMYGLDFAVHLALVGIDISPGGNIPLPPTLAPLKAQRIAARFDGAVVHRPGHRGARHEIAAELREDDAFAHGVGLVPAAADPLEAARNRGRRFNLHDEIDRAHVDAELE